MKYILTTPIVVGDLSNFVTIDELEVHSISMTFDPQMPVLSVVLVHLASGWKHTVTYTDSTAVEFWARTYEKELDSLCSAVVQKLITDVRLPAGIADSTPLAPTPTTPFASV